MILEVAMLQVKAGLEPDFEVAFAQAQTIIASMPGYHWHQLQRCLEVEGKYLLLVGWDSVAAHEQGFRQSAGYQQWKQLLHHFYEPFPVVEHYSQLFPVMLDPAGTGSAASSADRSNDTQPSVSSC